MFMIGFWKKDIINKLIVITSSSLIVVIAALTYLLFNMPEGKSLQGALVEYLPTQAVSLLPFSGTPTFEPANTALPTATLFPTATLIPFTSTPEPTLDLRPTATLAVSAVPTLPIARDCIPNRPSQTGKVLETLDGNTARVMIDGLVYTVRYIGVGIPTDADKARAAARANTDLVYGKDVILIADETDKDPSGRFLRYVLVGDTFVNLELIQSGFAPVADTPGAASCDLIFRHAALAPTSSPAPEDQP